MSKSGPGHVKIVRGTGTLIIQVLGQQDKLGYGDLWIVANYKHLISGRP